MTDIFEHANGDCRPGARRWTYLAIVVILPLLTQVGCAATYSSEAIHGKVIDAISRQPVEGAIVAMDWAVVGEEGRLLQQLAVMETLTDSHGEFEIPGWGPERMVLQPYAFLRNTEPTLRIFKPEYVPIVEMNRLVGDHYNDSGNNTIPSASTGMYAGPRWGSLRSPQPTVTADKARAHRVNSKASPAPAPRSAGDPGNAVRCCACGAFP